MQYGVLLVLAAGVAFYIYRSYARMTPAGTARHFGLDADERVAHMWLGEFDASISAGERVATAALGLVAGALLGGIGVASVRPLGVTALITTRRRLALILERPDKGVNRLFFASPAEIGITVLGPGPRRIQGGGSVLVDFVGHDGVPFRLLFHETFAPGIAAWRSGQ